MTRLFRWLMSVVFTGCFFTSALAGDGGFLVEPYLQSATPQGVWVLWESAAGNESTVEWGTSSALGQTASGSYIVGGNNSRIHEVNLDGLEPNTRYFYRVHTGEMESETFDFLTPPNPSSEASFRLVAMSDMQRDSANPDKFREVVEEGVIDFFGEQFGGDLSSELAMVLVPGDLVVNGWEASSFKDEFFSPAKELLTRVPVYPVLGNHESNTPFYFQYFHLPENGTSGYEEHWWYTDYSNLRVIGLDSNTGYQIQAQLNWLNAVLLDACGNDDIDFVFAELHHPHKSELWIAGELDYTGEVIARLETFTEGCGKPSIHFFGHTHGYSRGQSKDHAHLWVNVATAGGRIDHWGEYAQSDYEEFSVSQDEWGFVVVEVEAGDDPQFRLRRVSRGNETVPRDNEVRDDMTVRRDNNPPDTPTGVFPVGAEVNPDCMLFSGSEYSDQDADTHGGTQWQVALTCNDFASPIVDHWEQHENWYGGVDTQAGNSLEEEEVTELSPETSYCWRVRYRDQGLRWSGWSTPKPFETGVSAGTENLLENSGAESGVDGWVVDYGALESLTDGECDGISPYVGSRYFAVGGVCAEGQDGRAYQRVDLSEYEADIDQGNVNIVTSAYLSDWGGSDHPQIQVVLRDGEGNIVHESEIYGTYSSAWTPIEIVMNAEEGVRFADVVLVGTHYAGTDNDCYFDALSLRLWAGESEACQDTPREGFEPTDTGTIDTDTDTDSTTEDTGLETEDTSMDGSPSEPSCGCLTTPQRRGSGWLLLGLFAFTMAWRRQTSVI
jgi:hypothetical protein